MKWKLETRQIGLKLRILKSRKYIVKTDTNF